MAPVPPHVLVGIAALSMSLPLLAWSVIVGPDRERRQTVMNLQRGLLTTAGKRSKRQPEPENGRRVRTLARSATPVKAVRRLDRLLARAGRPPAWPLDRLLAAKLVLPLLAGALSVVYVSTNSSSVSVLMGIIVTIVSYFLPELLLYSRGQERSQQIALELPDTLDQMTVAVEAGLSFDSAMTRAGKNGKGPLAAELVRTLQDIQVGQTRRDAFEALAARTGVPDLRKFVRAVIQADAYGVSIADVLRTQAGEMRVKRRQRAEEKAMQIPVKVVFPLMLCILPVLFIVLLGPAVMDILAAFK
jgi:tight adherence protein C